MVLQMGKVESQSHCLGLGVRPSKSSSATSSVVSNSSQDSEPITARLNCASDQVRFPRKWDVSSPSRRT